MPIVLKASLKYVLQEIQSNSELFVVIRSVHFSSVFKWFECFRYGCVFSKVIIKLSEYFGVGSGISIDKVVDLLVSHCCNWKCLSFPQLDDSWTNTCCSGSRCRLQSKSLSNCITHKDMHICVCVCRGCSAAAPNTRLHCLQVPAPSWLINAKFA